MDREFRVIDFGDETGDTLTAVEDPQSARMSELAKHVRTLYCTCFREMTGDLTYGNSHMPRWDGDPTGQSGSRHAPVWPKIAGAIVSCDADPFDFIRAQFYGVQQSKPPYPNQLYNEQAVSRWETYRVVARSNLEKRIDSDLNQIQVNVLPFTVNLKWDYKRALDYVLRSQSCGASPLTRYCTAVAESLPIATAFRERALLQYVFQQADYDDLLKARIPQELREEATVLRDRLLGR